MRSISSYAASRHLPIEFFNTIGQKQPSPASVRHVNWAMPDQVASTSEPLRFATPRAFEAWLRKNHASHWLQRFTPRRARSLWSKANREKAETLIKSDRMQPSGMAEIARAKSDGRWDRAYDGARTAGVPPDLQAALDARPEARTFFTELDGANRYAVLWRIQTAKRAETRSRRIEVLVEMLARGEKIHG